jgi:phage I-like protein
MKHIKLLILAIAALVLPRREKVFGLANDLLAAAAGVLGIANDFQVSQDNWVQIAPYGDFPHPGPKDKTGKPLIPKGCLQRFDSGAANAIVKEFKSPMSRVGRALLGERPWYIGHPDVDPIKYQDHKSYGWIKDLENRADDPNPGLYARVDWAPDGEKLKADKSFKFFSPYWDVVQTADKSADGRSIVIPKRLNSVGFTNQPNLPVMPLANEEQIEILGTSDPAEMLVHHYASLGVIQDSERDEWLGYFNEDFQTAAWALANVDMALENADRSEAARKGWITRRANMGAAAAKMPKKAAKVAAKTRQATKPKAKGAAAKKKAAPVVKKKAAAAKKTVTPLPLPVKKGPPPLPGRKGPPPLPVRAVSVARATAAGHQALHQTTAMEDHPAFMQ